MRFYKRDGSFKINQEDCEFGWWFCDASTEENEGHGNKKNCKQNKYLIFEQNEIEDSTDLTRPLERDKELIIEKHEPSVEIHVPVCVQKSQMNPEVYVRNDDSNPFKTSDVVTYSRVKQNKRPLKFENFNSLRENLSNMIPSSTLKGKLLLSFIDAPRLGTLKENIPTCENQVESIPELEGPSVFLNCSFVAHNFSIFENQSCRSFHHQNEYYKNKKSLLAEMPALSEFSKTNDAYLINLNDSTRNLRASEKLDCLPSDSLKLSETETCGNKFIECTHLLHQNLNKLDDKICEMQRELVQIRIDFQAEDRRTARLLQESRKFLAEFRESNYQNEVLLLLMGQPEKIKSNNWPFKICSNQKQELNLII